MAWNGSNQSSQLVNQSINRKIEKSKNLSHGLLAGLIVVVGLLAALFFLRDPEEPAAPSEPAPREIATAAHSTNRVETAAVPAPAPAQPVRPAVAPAATGNVTRVRQTVQMRTLPDGTKVPVSRPYFSNHVERVLSTLCNPGGMAIPVSAALRRFSDEEILRILKAPMEYDKNDSEFILTRKMEMQRLKEEILDYLDEGHTMKEALAEIDKTVRRDSTYLMMSRHSMQEAMATKDGEVIRRYTKKLNEQLAERGMRPFEVPEQYRLPEGGADASDSNDNANEKENAENEDHD